MTMNDRSGASVDLVSNPSTHATSGKQDDLLVSAKSDPAVSRRVRSFDIDEALRRDASSPIHYTAMERRNMPSFLWCLNTSLGVEDMSPCRWLHSIAALCGNGLRPELQALPEWLAVDPHSAMLLRENGTPHLVQRRKLQSAK
jgi:hypothetical protein